MAKASYKQEPIVALELSMKEAQMLLDLSQSVGGDPTASRRGLFDAVGDALEGIGLKPSETKDYYGDFSFIDRKGKLQ